MQTEIFIKDGEPMAVFGSGMRDMRKEGKTLVLPGTSKDGENIGQTLFGELSLEDCDFNIQARVSLDEINDAGASFIIGGHYHYNSSPDEGVRSLRIVLDSSDGMIVYGFIESLSYPEEKRHFRHWHEISKEKITLDKPLEPGVPFTLDFQQKGEKGTFSINGTPVFWTTLQDKIIDGGGDGGWPVNFGFMAPGGAVVRLHDFSAEGTFARPALEITDLWVRGAESPNCHYRIPALCCTPGGILLAFTHASGREQSEAMKNTHTVMRHSTDSGRTWSPSRIIYNDVGGTDPSPLIDAETGTVFLFVRGGSDGSLTAIESHDDGVSWSAPRRINFNSDDMVFMTPGPMHGVQIADKAHKGRLTLACYGTLKGGGHPTCIVYSDDHGKTWQIGARGPDNTYEPQLIELSDGRLLMNYRQHDDLSLGRGISISHDGGQTFQEHYRDAALPSAGCQATLLPCVSFTDRPLPILFSSPAVGRRNLTVRVSRDDCASWPKSRLLYAGHSGYSAMALLPDGNIGLIFERDKYRRISFVAFTLQWLETN